MGGLDASAQPHGFHYSAHAHEVGSRPHINIQSASRFEHSHESGSDLLVESPVNLCLVPVFAGLVLNPLEVADRDAAGVTQKVGNDEYAARVEDLVGFGRRIEPGKVNCVGSYSRKLGNPSTILTTDLRKSEQPPFTRSDLMEAAQRLVEICAPRYLSFVVRIASR